jgi:hypothetical protein
MFYLFRQYFLIFVHQSKWCEVCCFRNCHVLDPYCSWHDLRPFAFPLTFKYFLDCLKYQGVGPFNRSIGLGLIYRCKGRLHSDFLMKVLEHCIVKVFCIIDCNVARDTITGQKFFLIVAEHTFVTGFASTHFVKYSMTITMKV